MLIFGYCNKGTHKWCEFTWGSNLGDPTCTHINSPWLTWTECQCFFSSGVQQNHQLLAGDTEGHLCSGVKLPVSPWAPLNCTSIPGFVLVCVLRKVFLKLLVSTSDGLHNQQTDGRYCKSSTSNQLPPYFVPLYAKPCRNKDWHSFWSLDSHTNIFNMFCLKSVIKPN